MESIIEVNKKLERKENSMKDIDVLMSVIRMSTAALLIKSSEYSLSFKVKFVRSAFEKIYIGECNSILKRGPIKDIMSDITA